MDVGFPTLPSAAIAVITHEINLKSKLKNVGISNSLDVLSEKSKRRLKNWPVPLERGKMALCFSSAKTIQGDESKTLGL